MPGRPDAPPSRLSRTLDRIARGPAGLVRPLVVVVFSSALLAILIAVVVRPHGLLPARQLAVIGPAWLATATAGAVLLLWPRLEPHIVPLDASPRRDLATTALLVLIVVVPLLLIPTYFFVHTTLGTVHDWAIYGGVDRRWMTTLFLLGALGPLVLGTLAAAVVRVASDRPDGWRGLARSITARAPADAAERERVQAPRRSAAITALKVLLGLGIAYYFYGPPWYLPANHKGIDYHEGVWLAGLQAIRNGAVPYVHAANVQYGPGSQLGMYLYMRKIGGFTIIGFRETFAVFQWLGASIFFAVVFARFRLLGALLAGLLAALVFPTLQMLRFVDDKVYAGFFGWSDVLRYAGVLAVALLYAPAIERGSTRARRLVGLALGLFWGLCTYMAQENLAGGVLVLAALTAVFLASRTYMVWAVVDTLASVVAGLVLVWLPVLAYYTWHGDLVLFVRLYLLVPLAVTRGYSNTPYLEGWHSPWGRMYYLLPFVLAAFALLSVVELRPLRIAERWDRRRTLLVSVLAVAIVADQASMLRADQTHLVNTMLAVPVVFVAALLLLPRTLGLQSVWTTVLARALVVVVALLLVPRAAYTVQALHRELLAPYDDRQKLAAMHEEPAPPSGAGARLGAGLIAARRCCSESTVSMRRLVGVMNHIHAVVGDRITYVNGFRDGYPGLVYFLADLRPAPSLLDPYTMAITSSLVQESLGYFERHIRDVQAEVVMNPASAEALDFKRAYPRYRLVKIPYPRSPVYILLRPA